MLLSVFGALGVFTGNKNVAEGENGKFEKRVIMAVDQNDLVI